MGESAWLIVGLGNPGDRYADTRHNVGFMVLDRLAAILGAPYRTFRETRLARTNWNGQPVLFAKPQTYMNRSGRAVRLLVDYFDLDLARTVVIYDDVALPLGRVRIRRSGSAGGQKGMKSIISSMGTMEISRLRVGIGPDHPVADLPAFVLKRFARADRTTLEEVLDRSVEAVKTIVSEGPDAAMQRFNGLESPEKPGQ